MFLLFFSCLVIQRIGELILAKRNELYLKAEGAYEVGAEHYKYIVWLHMLFLLSLFVEVEYVRESSHQFHWLPLLMFLIAQLLRIWSIASLGRHWNTKIWVVPGKQIINQGPYKYLAHPNYLVVMVEIVTIPLIFSAYLTAIIFSLLNMYILFFIRIPIEEAALRQAADYDCIGRK